MLSFTRSCWARGSWFLARFLGVCLVAAAPPVLASKYYLMLIQDPKNQPVRLYGLERSDSALAWSHLMNLDERFVLEGRMVYCIEFEEYLDEKCRSNEVTFAVMHKDRGILSRFNYRTRFDDKAGTQPLIFPTPRDQEGMKEFTDFLAGIKTILVWAPANIAPPDLAMEPEGEAAAAQGEHKATAPSVGPVG